MVARPQLGVVIDRMTLDDLPQVEAIEHEAFTTPWPKDAYRSELTGNGLAHYVVARCDERVVGFAGLWMMVDEAHITTFAVRRGWRRHGIGERLLIGMLDIALARQAKEATLEVRPSNFAARRLYEKYGFVLVGVRSRYYTDNNEDALIMTTPPLQARDMVERLARLRSQVERRPPIALGDDGLPVGPKEADEGEASGEHAAEPGSPRGREGGHAVGPDFLRPSDVRRSR
jgi:ribosomal-protein-alanine N-acetyltransferase